MWSSEEITAAKDAALESFPLIADLFSGGIEPALYIAGAVGVIGAIALAFRGLFWAVGIRKLP